MSIINAKAKVTAVQIAPTRIRLHCKLVGDYETSGQLIVSLQYAEAGRLMESVGVDAEFEVQLKTVSK